MFERNAEVARRKLITEDGVADLAPATGENLELEATRYTSSRSQSRRSAASGAGATVSGVDGYWTS